MAGSGRQSPYRQAAKLFEMAMMRVAAKPKTLCRAQWNDLCRPRAIGNHLMAAGCAIRLTDNPVSSVPWRREAWLHR